MFSLRLSLGPTNAEQRKNLETFLRDLEHHKPRTFRSLHSFTAACESLGTYLVFFSKLQPFHKTMLTQHIGTKDLRRRLCYYPVLDRPLSPNRQHGSELGRAVRMGG